MEERHQILDVCSETVCAWALFHVLHLKYNQSDYISLWVRFFVWLHVCGITKSYQMRCKLTRSNVACHGLVRQTSLTSLQMENSLCCIVFHMWSHRSRSPRAHSPFFLSLSPWIKSRWWQIDGITMVCGVDFRGLFWLSADPARPWSCLFSPSLTFGAASSPLLLFYPVRSSSSTGGGCRQSAGVYFDLRRKFRLGESVQNCFSFTSPGGLMMWEQQCQLLWQNNTIS